MRIRERLLTRGTLTAAVAVAAACTGASRDTPAPDGAQPAPVVDLPEIDAPLADVPVPGAATTLGHAFFTNRRAFDDALLERLRAPEGFAVDVFARGLGAPRMIEVGPDGAAYVTRPAEGEVVRLADRDGDGRAEERRTVISGLEGVHGIAVDGTRLYLADVNHVYVAEREPDGGVGRPRVIVRLPEGGQHGNRTLEIGPDGMLYLTIGSMTNAWPTGNPLEATMLRVGPDGSDLRIFARNLRNTLGFGWHPETGELWGMDQGIDWLGDAVQEEELNRIVEGGDYGWPYCYEDREPNPTRPPPEGYESLAAYCATTVPMVLGYTAHAAPMGMAFYTGAQFPAGYRGDAFVAMHGSWNRYPPSGYEIVRIRYDGGRPVAIEPFVTGWLLEDGRTHFGRPVGVAVARDGSLLVTDDANGVVYRIRYTGG